MKRSLTMFYQMFDRNPYRFFTQLPHLHTDSCAESADEATETQEAAPWSPVVDVLETAEAFKLVCEVPGFDAASIDLKIEQEILTISGERKTGSDAEGVKLVRGERRHGKFTRTFVLPREVDATAIKASCVAGILEVTLPKSSALLPRKVEIAGA